MNDNRKWITSPVDPGAAAVSFCRPFSVEQPVKQATLSVSAIGLYAASINGQRVGDGVLTPGFTSYRNRVQYQTYDVTSLLNAENRIEIGVGQGWAVGYLSWDRTNHYFADHTSLIAWLDIDYADGTREQISTDEGWQVYTTPVTSSEIYHDETVDLTAPIRCLGNAQEDRVETRLDPQEGEWIKEQERLAPVELIVTPKGERVIDFGQNMTGYVEVKIQGPRGSRVVLHHAEVLDKEGNFYTENFRAARNENVYVLSGGADSFKPTYCFQGFRYIRLTEYPFETVELDNFRAIVVHSDLKRTGHFVCGNEKINQLYHNIIWGQKSNYLDIPTDCPQRDERLGWTGDAQVFFRTASINFDVERFFRKWLEDVALEQELDGAVRGVVPGCQPTVPTLISAGWGDVACIVPWQLYLTYGDRELLKKHYPMMQKWVEYMHGAGPEEYLWLEGGHYGDWLAMDNGGEICVGATDTELIASAFYAYSTSLLIKAGEVLGEDVTEYRALYDHVVAAFRARFLKNGMPEPTGCQGITQTALVLILYFDLCEAQWRKPMADKLAELIRQFGNRMTTGFLGTPYILHVLSDNGYTDLAYTLLFQENSPSWLYSVCHGATTMWEHWNSLKEDGTFWDTGMNSFNHYAYGAVFDWIFAVCAGIRMEDPAYRRIRLEPRPDKRLGFTDTSIDTRSGFLRSAWYYKGDRVYCEFTVPQGVTAEVCLPSGYRTVLGGGTYHFAE